MRASIRHLAIRTALVLPGPILAALPAQADVDWFQTPSRNIECSVGFGPDSSDIACRIATIDGAPTTPRPDGCTGAYGQGVSMLSTGPVRVECGTPAPITAGDQVFDYGETRDFGGITCTVDTDGLLCTNQGGHGFFLSRARQTVF